jgi:hypothetical protein
MILYHEVSNDAIQSILREGLKRNDRGEKGDDQDIIETDEYLDATQPLSLKKTGLSRSNNIYAFIGEHGSIIDIKDGSVRSLKDYMSDRDSVLLKLTVDPAYCYVSDLDKYDAVKSSYTNNDKLRAYDYAHDYWNSVIPLAAFKPNTIRRPEVMIVKDLPPELVSAQQF